MSCFYRLIICDVLNDFVMLYDILCVFMGLFLKYWIIIWVICVVILLVDVCLKFIGIK